MKKTLIVLISIVASGTLLLADQPDIPNLKEPRAGIYTAGQPTEAGIQEMASKGVKMILNIRSATEQGARDESQEAASLNIRYVSMPITPETYTMEKVKEFSSLLADENNRPILVHCSSANRVGGLWFAYRVLLEKADQETALQEARDIGMKPALEPVILKFVEEQTSGSSGNPR